MRVIQGSRVSRAFARALTLALSSVALLAPGVSAAPAEPMAAIAPAFVVDAADACLDDEEVGFLALINDYRAASGLRPLSVSTSLSAAAAYHSADMAANRYLDHTRIDGKTVQQSMADFGYAGGLYGENIAAGTATGPEAMQTWQGSAEHNANMLNGSFGAIGIGRAYDPESPYGWYWTTIFGDENDGPGWLCGETAPPSKSVNLFQSADGAIANSDVNLRTGPGANYPVVATLVPTTEMAVTGRALEGYLPVNIDGQYGWVASEWVDEGVVSFEQTAAPVGSAPGTATAIGVVELRGAPAADSPMLGTIPAVEVVTLTGEAQDGFLKVVYDGQEGWADAAYLEVAEAAPGATLLQSAEIPMQDAASAAPAAPDTGTTAGAVASATSDVNLREQPNPSSAVLGVVPAGSQVSLTGSKANGYVNVRINGQAGWIDERYLQS
jgi:uncharacterized protein YkwD/uncharacterized protein YraI